MGAFTKIGYKQIRISKRKRMLFHIPCTPSLPQLLKKGVVLSWNINRCNCTCLIQQDKNVQMMVKLQLIINHESQATLIEPFHIVERINWGFFCWKLVNVMSSWPPKGIPKMNNQWHLIMGRPKGVKRGGNLGLPHPFQQSRAKG